MPASSRRRSSRRCASTRRWSKRRTIARSPSNSRRSATSCIPSTSGITRSSATAARSKNIARSWPRSKRPTLGVRERCWICDSATSARSTSRKKAVLLHNGAAVDDQTLPGDEIGIGGGEKGDRPDQILGALDAFEGAPLDGTAAHLQDVLVGIFFAERAPRDDRVHADVVLPEFARQRPGEPDDPGLGGHVVNARRGPLEVSPRTHVDDLAVALHPHVRDDGAAREPGPAQIDGHQLVPFLRVDLVETETRHRDRRENRCIIHEDVDLPELLHGAAGHRFGPRLIGHVGRDRDRPESALFELLGDGVAGARVELGDHDRRAFGGKTARIRSSDPVAAAGDDRDAAFQSAVHGASFRRGRFDLPLGPPVCRHVVGLLLFIAALAAGSPGFAAEIVTGIISGRVTATTGEPIAGARVTAQSPSGKYTAITAADGRYTLVGVAPDTYTVSVAAAQYESQTTRVALRKVHRYHRGGRPLHARRSRDRHLHRQRRRGSIRIPNHPRRPPESTPLSPRRTAVTRSSESRSAPTPSASPRLNTNPKPPASPSGKYTAITAADGRYTLVGVEIGTYTVSVAAAQYESQTTRVALRKVHRYHRGGRPLHARRS